MLALSFLVMVGFMLFRRSEPFIIVRSQGYAYVAWHQLRVELLNMRAERKHR